MFVRRSIWEQVIHVLRLDVGRAHSKSYLHKHFGSHLIPLRCTPSVRAIKRWIFFSVKLAKTCRAHLVAKCFCRLRSLLGSVLIRQLDSGNFQKVPAFYIRFLVFSSFFKLSFSVSIRCLLGIFRFFDFRQWAVWPFCCLSLWELDGILLWTNKAN
jgi:hypothetical protein